MLVVILMAALPTFAGDIIFTNKVESFTNLQGVAFKHVTLVKGDLDGVIWRDAPSGGRICYTNLHPELLESWGISSNRIDIALARAQHKAVADAKYRAAWAAEAQNKALQDWLTDVKPEPDKPNANTTARAQQQAADLARIRAMQSKYDALDREDRYTRAAVIDQGGYINHVAEERLEDFRRSLEKAKRQYLERYGSEPPD